MTKTIEISEARDHFDEIVSAALEGIEVVIAKDRNPLVRVVAEPRPQGKRVAGLGRGEIRIGDDFDAPLPESFWMGGK